MTDPIARARSQLEELIQLQPEYEQYAELLSLRGHGWHLTAITSPTGSTVENTVIRLETQRAPLDALHDIATAWGYTHGNILQWMASNIDSADIKTEHLDTIAWAHGRITRLINKPTLGPPCPLHDHLPATHITNDGLHCPDCGYTRTPEEHQALTNWQLRNHNPLVTRRQAAHILGEDENTLKQRIRRWNPDYHTIDGIRHYMLDDLHNNDVP